MLQFSRTGACSQSTGPRISAWQVVHISPTELPLLSALPLVIDPCGLWQVVQLSRSASCSSLSMKLMNFSQRSIFLVPTIG